MYYHFHSIKNSITSQFTFGTCKNKNDIYAWNFEAPFVLQPWIEFAILKKKNCMI